MYRSKTCGELRLSDAGSVVTLAGWVQRSRKMGGMTFVDLRDRYGLTQLVFNEAADAALCDQANKLGREYCIQVKGEVSERQSKNPKMPTGDIEILVKELNVLSESQTPPFTIEDNTDGGDDIRMKYRYLDLRRSVVRKNLERITEETNNLVETVRDHFTEFDIQETTELLAHSTPILILMDQLHQKLVESPLYPGLKTAVEDYCDCVSIFQELCSDLQTFNIDLRQDEEFQKTSELLRSIA